MKLSVVIISVFVAQTSASFFDFGNTFGLAQNSFEKLLNDVVTDVKVTIDCTIMAVEEVLSLNGMFGNHSNYEKICKGQSEDIITQNAVRDARELTKDLSHHIEESVAKIDKTIESLIDKRGTPNNQFHIDIKQIEDDAINETTKDETDKLPKDFRAVVKQIVKDDKSQSEKLINQIDAAFENNTESLSPIIETLPPLEINPNGSVADEVGLPLELFGPKDTAHDKAMKETEKFIQQSQYTQMLMNSFLNSNQETAVNLFDNPELLSLG